MTSQEWFHLNVHEDVEFVKNIGEQSRIALRSKFNITLKNPEIPIAIYGVILESIKKFLHEKQKTHSSYSINIADTLEIGYTSGFEDEDTDAEKIGNFMIYYKNIDNNSFWEKNIDERNCSVLCTEWVAANVNASTEDLKEIGRLAYDNLKSEINVWPPSQDTIIPMFCTIHGQIIAAIKLAYSQATAEQKDDFSFNFAGLYEISIIELEDGIQIQLKPMVSDKGTFKNDNGISAKYE